MAAVHLAKVLDELAGLAGDADRESLATLRERLASSRLRVLVAGEAKRGKSTLVNALLGRDLLPTGVTPLTAVPTTVVSGVPEAAEVAFADGRLETLALDALQTFGTERGNPGNARRVESITVRTQAPVLARGAEIVDTPGTGSVHAHNTAAAEAVLPSMDAAIFVLSADPPVSASERALLAEVARLSVRLFVVLNKIDYLDDAELAESLAFTEQVVSAALGRQQPVYAVSARGLGPAGSRGLARFAADFESYLKAGRIGDLETSVREQAARVASLMLDEMTLAQQTARLPGEQAAQQAAGFAARLASVREHQADAEDTLAGQTRRLLTALNAAADRMRPQIAADVTASITRRLSETALGGESAAEIERTGRAELTRDIVAAAEAWRQEQAAELEAGLQQIDARLCAGLEAELAAVREAAADLLGVRLTLPSPGSRLASGRRFFYVVAEQVDQAELLAGAVRRRVPGELGRKIARQRVLEQIPDLADVHVGRARGDLQFRLSEASRNLGGEVRRRYAETTDRLAAALERAAAIRASTADQGERELAELADRGARLRALLAELAPDGQPA